LAKTAAPETALGLSINECNALIRVADSVRDRALITLVLATGITLKETAELKTSDIDWDSKTLQVDRREIPLNEQVFQALSEWSRERVDCKTDALFITQKGKLKALSKRSIDHVMRECGKKAGIERTVTSRILRHTFAQRLLKTADKEEVAKVMGISSQNQSMGRYEERAKQLEDEPIKTPFTPIQEQLEVITDAVDTRHPLHRFLAKLIPSKHHRARKLTDIPGPIEAHPEEIIFGRERLVKTLNSRILSGQTMLILGEAGVGKTHLMKHLHTQIPGSLYVPTPSPAKPMLQQICERISPGWTDWVPVPRTNVAMLNWIEQQPRQDWVLFLDNLHQLRQPDVRGMEILLSKMPVVAACQLDLLRATTLQWKFKKVELGPLSEEASRKLIQYLSQNLPVSDPEFLENQLLRQANGNPLVILDMLNQLRHERILDSDTIRNADHQLGVTYRDWSIALILLWGLAITGRFIALGSHSFEGYILAGFGTSVIVTVRVLMSRRA